MKEFINEHADLICGAFATGAIMGMLLKMISPGGSIYMAVLAFTNGIC
jgi:hypothetical protein